jgi:hypothetical protein
MLLSKQLETAGSSVGAGLTVGTGATVGAMVGQNSVKPVVLEQRSQPMLTQIPSQEEKQQNGSTWQTASVQI